MLYSDKQVFKKHLQRLFTKGGLSAERSQALSEETLSSFLREWKAQEKEERPTVTIIPDSSLIKIIIPPSLEEKTNPQGVLDKFIEKRDRSGNWQVTDSQEHPKGTLHFCRLKRTSLRNGRSLEETFGEMNKEKQKATIRRLKEAMDKANQ